MEAVSNGTKMAALAGSNVAIDASTAGEIELSIGEFKGTVSSAVGTHQVALSDGTDSITLSFATTTAFTDTDTGKSLPPAGLDNAASGQVGKANFTFQIGTDDRTGDEKGTRESDR